MQVSKVLRAMSDGRYGYYCPGCDMLHVTTPDVKLVDFNITKPSFTQPIKIGRGRDSVCLHSINGGMMTFSPDSRHKLRGKSAPMPDLPPEYQDSPK